MNPLGNEVRPASTNRPASVHEWNWQGIGSPAQVASHTGTAINSGTFAPYRTPTPSFDIRRQHAPSSASISSPMTAAQSPAFGPRSTLPPQPSLFGSIGQQTPLFSFQSQQATGTTLPPPLSSQPNATAVPLQAPLAAQQQHTLEQQTPFQQSWPHSQPAPSQQPEQHLSRSSVQKHGIKEEEE